MGWVNCPNCRKGFSDIANITACPNCYHPVNVSSLKIKQDCERWEKEKKEREERKKWENDRKEKENREKRERERQEKEQKESDRKARELTEANEKRRKEYCTKCGKCKQITWRYYECVKSKIQFDKKLSDFYDSIQGCTFCVDCKPLRFQVGENYKCVNSPQFKGSISRSMINQGCYIATMCYGDYNCKQVIIFRYFRDEYLNKTKLGKILIIIYYNITPRIVKLLKNKHRVNIIIRNLLLEPIYRKLIPKYIKYMTYNDIYMY
jgi:hypothetical protein